MARKIINVGGMSRECWMEQRRRGIGGSDAAAVCGVSPYKSALQIYLEKTRGITEASDTEPCVIGRDLEDYVAKRFEQKTGKRTRRDNFMYCHDKYDFLIADLDRRVIGEAAGLECKTASAFSRADFASGRLPEHYLLQCYHYMAVMGFERMYLAVLVLGRDFRVFNIERDESKIDALIDTELDFWYSNVMASVPPPPNGSSGDAAKVREICEESVKKEGICDLSHMKGDFERLFELERQMKALEVRSAAIKQKIQLSMAGYAGAECGSYIAKNRKRQKRIIDMAALRKNFPKAYKSTLRQISVDSFNIKYGGEAGSLSGKNSGKL